MQKGFKQVNLEGCVSGTLAVPVIGENGNWFIGNDDTGVCAIGAGGGGTHYSEEEQDIGTWIDGSVLYRKVIAFGALPNTDTKNVTHGIINLNTVVSLHAIAKNTVGTSLVLPHTSAATLNNSIPIHATTTNIVIVTRANYSDYVNGYALIEYTKTSQE